MFISLVVIAALVAVIGSSICLLHVYLDWWSPKNRINTQSFSKSISQKVKSHQYKNNKVELDKYETDGDILNKELAVETMAFGKKKLKENTGKEGNYESSKKKDSKVVIDEDGKIEKDNSVKEVDEKEEEKEIVKTKKVKPTLLQRICNKIRKRKRTNVNATENDWKGPVTCTIVKDVNTWDKKQTQSKFEEKIVTTTYESVKESWNRSLYNLLITRSPNAIQPKDVKSKLNKMRRKKKRFKVYRTEKLIVETVSLKNPKLKSIYTIVHVKRWRPFELKITKCKYCKRHQS